MFDIFSGSYQVGYCVSNKSFGTFENVIQKVSTKFLNFSFQFFYKYLSKIASQGWGIEQH